MELTSNYLKTRACVWFLTSEDALPSPAMFEQHQVSSQYQACSPLPCFLCTATDIGSSSYDDAHEHSCACTQADAAQQLLRETAMH